MYCPKCGKENLDNSAYCIYCGEKLVKSERNDETTVLRQDYSINNPSQFVPGGNGQQSAYYSQQYNTPKKNKKLSKGAIIAIVVVSVLILAALGFGAEKLIQYQKAVDAVESIETPEIPDFDMDSDFDTYADSSSESSIGFGDVDGNEYVNSYADLKFVSPADEWSFLSKEEINQFYSDLETTVSFDETTKETYYEDINGKVYYDMVMINTVDNSNVQVMLVENDGDNKATLDDYFNMFESELSSSYEDATFESAGIMTLGSNIYSVKKCNATVYGSNVVQYYAGANVDDGFVIIVATFSGDDDVNFLQFFDQITAD